MYAADWLSDTNVRIMSLEQRGAYVELLCHDWREGSVPDDPEQLARLAGLDPSYFAENVWPVLSAHFIADGPGRLTNKRLSAVRHRQSMYVDGQKKRARKRWQTKDIHAAALPGQCNSKSESESETEVGLQPRSSGRSSGRSTTKPPVHTLGDRCRQLPIGDGDLSGSGAAPRVEGGSLEGFEDMWRLYDHKLGKQEAQKAYKRLELSRRDDLRERIMAFIPRYHRTNRWKRGARLRLSTLLNNERWNDDVADPDDWKAKFLAREK